MAKFEGVFIYMSNWGGLGTPWVKQNLWVLTSTVSELQCEIFNLGGFLKTSAKETPLSSAFYLREEILSAKSQFKIYYSIIVYKKLKINLVKMSYI